MPRTSKILTLSVPEDMANKIDKLAKAENRTRSEFIREAVREYIASRERWREIRSWGRSIANDQGLTEADIEAIVDEMRHRGQ